MRRALLTVLASSAAISFASPASAAVLVADGITYNLMLDSITNGGKTGNFTLSISGINTASDTEGGRTGINGFAFTNPTVGNAVGGTSTGFTWQVGGLSASGCDGSGGFYCFKNTGFVLPPLGAGGSMSLDFSVISDTAGTWDPSNWGDTHFKIDWDGTQNKKGNYDLVSLAIPLNTGVPEPATWAMMLLGFGGIGLTMRRRRRTGLAQLA